MKTWRERVADAEVRGSFTAEDRELALDWTTCAVGEQRALHPEVVVYIDLGGDPSPCDGYLEALGGYWGFGCQHGFFGAIQNNEPALARQRLDQIEDRVLQLKREAQP